MTPLQLVQALQRVESEQARVTMVESWLVTRGCANCESIRNWHDNANVSASRTIVGLEESRLNAISNMEAAYAELSELRAKLAEAEARSEAKLAASVPRDVALRAMQMTAIGLAATHRSEACPYREMTPIQILAAAEALSKGVQ